MHHALHLYGISWRSSEYVWAKEWLAMASRYKGQCFIFPKPISHQFTPQGVGKTWLALMKYESRTPILDREAVVHSPTALPWIFPKWLICTLFSTYKESHTKYLPFLITGEKSDYNGCPKMRSYCFNRNKIPSCLLQKCSWRRTLKFVEGIRIFGDRNVRIGMCT